MRPIIISICIITILISCGKQNNIDSLNLSNEFSPCTSYLFDIIDGKEKDTIEVCLDSAGYLIKLPKEKTIRVYKRILDINYHLSEPPVERMYIEPNNVQSHEKGIRIKLRNTDFMPEYDFLDVQFKENKWYVINMGKAHLTPSESFDSTFCEVKKVNKSFESIYSGQEFYWRPSIDFMDFKEQ